MKTRVLGLMLSITRNSAAFSSRKIRSPRSRLGMVRILLLESDYEPPLVAKPTV